MSLSEHPLSAASHTIYSKPEQERRVIITYRNMPVSHNVSHIGLGVSALNTAKVLKENGIWADVWPILGAKQLAERIEKTNPRPSHIVLCAPWLPTLDLQVFLVFRFPEIQFAVVCHSNVGFLQADPQAIKNFREDLDLEQGALNFFAAGNSPRFCKWIEEAYTRPCQFLPNLYFLGNNRAMHRRPWSGGTIRIGVFGAVRPLKNQLSAAAAALEIANDFHEQVEFHINVSRVENNGSTVVRSLEAMLNGSVTVHLVKEEWFQWPKFRHLVRSMNLLMQPSYTESFNMVTADGAAESIPSVVSDAIYWAPRDWMADVDDPLYIARVGKHLLRDTNAGAEGFEALQQNNVSGVRAWKQWLGL